MGDKVYQHTLRVLQKGQKSLYLSHHCLRDMVFPNIFKPEFGHIIRLDLGYNFLQNLPPEIGTNLPNLEELWANDNKLLVSTPVSSSVMSCAVPTASARKHHRNVSLCHSLSTAAHLVCRLLLA